MTCMSMQGLRNLSLFYLQKLECCCNEQTIEPSCIPVTVLQCTVVMMPADSEAGNSAAVP